MGLTIVSSQPLDQLQAWAHQYFAGIENKQIDSPSFEGTAFGETFIFLFLMWLVVSFAVGGGGGGTTFY